MSTLIKYLWWSQFHEEFAFEMHDNVDNVDIVSAAFAVREGKVPLGPQPEMDVWRLLLHINVNLQNTTLLKYFPYSSLCEYFKIFHYLSVGIV